MSRRVLPVHSCTGKHSTINFPRGNHVHERNIELNVLYDNHTNLSVHLSMVMYNLNKTLLITVVNASTTPLGSQSF